MRRRQQGGIIFRLVALLFLALFLAGLYVVRHPLMRTAARLWIVSDPVMRADAVIVVGDDNFTSDRAARAAELFRSGQAAQVVASGRKLRPYVGIPELTARDLKSRGVPTDKIIEFTHETHGTLEEARSLGRLVAEKRWHTILVVTSNYHARRMRYAVRKVFPAGVMVGVLSVRDPDFDPDSWWLSWTGRRLFCDEVMVYWFTMWQLRGT